MRWRNRDESSNVEDRRGSRGPRGLPGLPVGMMRGPGIIIVLLVIVAGSYFGIDFTPMLTGEMEPGSSQPYTATPEEQELARFTSVVLKTTEETWGELFQEMGKTYQQPRLVMYTGATSTTCGYGQAAMGPFYCPEDETVYIDLSFYQDMKNKLGGGGDFAQGYVIAHEVGHHVQHLLGIEPQVRRLQQGASRSEANRLSVMLELQADCFAGVWGRAMEDQGILESGDLQEALRTAQAIGDDRLQKQTQGYVVPDSFTHGTSQQRYAWFRRGFDSGDPGCCNTFKEMGHALNSAIVGNCN